MTERKLEYGLQPPEGTTLCWGARAIYQSNGRGGLMVDIVWDRQSTLAPEANGRPAWEGTAGKLLDAVNGWAIPLLRHKAAKRELAEPNERMDFEASEGSWHVKANPNGSYGYLYIVVWWESTAEPTMAPTFKAPKPKAQPRRRTLTLPRNRF